jgi:hypothetical protein
MDLQAIGAYHATYIALALLAFLLCVVPLFEKIPKLGDCVSRRYVIVVVFVVMALACILNFNALDTSIKSTVIVGALIVSTIYLCVRSIEKWLYAGFFAKAGKIEVDVDDKKLSIENAEVGKKKEDDKKSEEPDDLKGLAERENNE